MNVTQASCRSCGSPALDAVFSLGAMPLANAFLTAEELEQFEPRYPLDLIFCQECALLQVKHSVSPDELFRQYLYFSSVSQTTLLHAQELARRLIRSRRLDTASLALEIGSNDGYLLQFLAAAAIPVMGIDPAHNVTKVAESRGVPTLCEFFSEGLARRLCDQGLLADVVIANNVLAHAADLNGFVRGVAAVLKPAGVAIFEVPYVRHLVEGCEFDTAYHEHLCYFSLTALDRLFNRHGMVVGQLENIPAHGGSLRLFVTHQNGNQRSDAVWALLDEERARGINHLGYYLTLGQNVERIKTGLLSLLRSAVSAGKRLAGYGASAKGTILLNYCEIGKDLLGFVADRSPHKQGRYVPGVRLPIVPPARLLSDQPDYTLLLAWNIADEVLEQEAEYRRRGGRFIIPIPEPKFSI